MAKQKPKKAQYKHSSVQAPVLPADKPIFPITSFKLQALVILLLGFGIYCNSFSNKYALDDDIVMRLNDYVQQGFAGMGKIMTTDAYDSFFKSMGSSGELSGGRYRPLSILTFAAEQQLFGKCYGTRMLEVRDSLANMQIMRMYPNVANRLITEKAALEAKISQSHESIATIRHVVSVTLYVFSVVLLLLLLRDYIFKYANLKYIHPYDISFFAAIIFLVHPIHTEVVANVKSRDEILSFMFIVLTFIYIFRHTETKKSKDLYLGLLFYFLALLSKEWGITLVLLIPLAFYIFKKYSFIQCLKSSFPYFGVALFYLMLRYLFVGAGKQGAITEVLNNPYVYATPIQARATQIFILIKYLGLLIFPHPLSADYSWKTIPYNSFGDAMVWFSLFIYCAMVYYMIVYTKRRNWIAFAIAFYLFHLFLVSNLAMPIGATMGERLIYHSSLGFVMVAAFLLLSGINKLTKEPVQKRILQVLLFFLLVVPMSYATIVRNPDWKTDNILFIHDAWVVPNSVLANGNAGKAFIEYAQKDTANRVRLLDSAIYHLKKAVALHPKYVNGFLNLGLAYFQEKNLDTAEYYWGFARRYFPTHPFFRQSYDPALASALVERAKQEGKSGNLPKALADITHALRYDSTNASIWYHYGGANYAIGNMNEAYRAWNKCLQLNPNNADAKKGLEYIRQRLGQTQQSKTINQPK